LVTRIVCVRAPNPSALTLDGTNSYLIFGDGEALCIDPGPQIASHLENLQRVAAAAGARIAAICVTHGHPDHAPGAPLLAAATGAPVHAFAANLDTGASLRGGALLRDGCAVAVRGAFLTAYEAPGHTSDSLVFYEARERALFAGDVVLGTGTVVVAPPGGDMRAYQATLARLLERFRDARTIYGGHGPPVSDVRKTLLEYMEHRQTRETEILATLDCGEKTIPAMVRIVYANVDAQLWPAAARQVLAYLLALEREGRIRSRPMPEAPDSEDAAMLNPDWTKLAGSADARVLEAELGAPSRLEWRAYSNA
jgi:glyoxylase-like metal-dependent hydrolase (beta-lactamase superfamily II)